MNPRNTGILFLVALLVVGGVWWSENVRKDRVQEAEAEARTLFPDTDAEDVSFVLVETTDRRSARLERRDGLFRLVEPLDFAADRVSVEGIVNALAEVRSDAVIESPQDPTVYGLGAEASTIRFGSSEGEHVLRLERELTKLSRQREERRRRRNRRDVPVLSIVGYTNGGKSTLLRALTKSDVLVEDKMFATLDPTSRRLRFPREREVIITDTVGFIRDLPRDLVSAFHATLEELSDAGLLLHLIDAAAPDLERRIKAVRDVLEEIGLGDAPELLVFNQIDRLPDGAGQALAARFGGIAVSALNRTGLRDLLIRAEQILWSEEAANTDPSRSWTFIAEGA